MITTEPTRCAARIVGQHVYGVFYRVDQKARATDVVMDWLFDRCLPFFQEDATAMLDQIDEENADGN